MKPLLLCVALCLFCPTVALAEAITAEWNLEVDMNSYAGFGVRALAWKRGQTFVAGTTGTLDSASFRLYRNYEQLTPDLRFEVYAVGGDGLPTGPTLHSEDFPTAHVAYGQPALPYTFAFTGTAPELEQGLAYAVVLTAVEPENGALFTLNGFSDPRNDYSAGSGVNQAWGETGWTFIGGDADRVDFGFQVTVEPLVPTEAMSWGQMKGQYHRP